MDNFMDKLAQKLNAQEMIKANSAAEAAQINKLQSRIAEYDAALQELRKMGLKNAEAADKLNQFVSESMEQVEKLTEESIGKIQAIQSENSKNEEMNKKLTELSGKEDKISSAVAELTSKNEEAGRALAELTEILSRNKEELEEMFKKTEEYVHTEDVKVYRNVQAVVVEENAKQTETITKQQQSAGTKTTAILAISIVGLIGIAANIVLMIMQLANFKLF